MSAARRVSANVGAGDAVTEEGLTVDQDVAEIDANAWRRLASGAGALRPVIIPDRDDALGM